MIELIVVMAIMGSLVTLATPDFLGQRDRAQINAIQNDVMLAESKINETDVLNRNIFDYWESFPEAAVPGKTYTDISGMVEDGNIFDEDGVAELNPKENGKKEPFIFDYQENGQTYRYEFKQVPQDYIDGRIYTNIVGENTGDGVFFVRMKAINPGAEKVTYTADKVYYYNAGKSYRTTKPEEDIVIPPAPEEEPPVATPEPEPELEPEPEGPAAMPILPNSPIAPDWGDWRYDDFTYSGNQVTGLSQQGKQRNWSNAENNLVLPDVNPYTGDRIVTVREQGFKNEHFGGGIFGESIEEIEKQSFMNGGWSGDFYMPNVEHIGDKAFMNGHLTGSFHAPNAISIGHDAFANSKFLGTFTAEHVEFIGKGAFRNSEFTGTFNAPNIREVDNHAFPLSKFSGAFPNTHNPKIGTQAFRDSQFANGQYGGSIR